MLKKIGIILFMLFIVTITQANCPATNPDGSPVSRTGGTAKPVLLAVIRPIHNGVHGSGADAGRFRTAGRIL